MKINCDLHNVFQGGWIKALCLNPMKSKILIIGKVNYMAQLSPLQINNTSNEIVDNTKNLEVIFNNRFNCSNHINGVWLAQYFTPFNIRMLIAETYLIRT